MLINQVENPFFSDAVFDKLYPIYIRRLSERHWTPLHIAFMAARFLAPGESSRVIDIGAGVGKFCIAGKYHSPGKFTGIEQRKNFVRIGNKVIGQLGLSGVELVCGNFTDLDITAYTGIYFFNSFHENIAIDDSLDDKIERSSELYQLYTTHLYNQLEKMPVSTRLATYWLSANEIPGCYKLRESHFDDLLKLWEKEF